MVGVRPGDRNVYDGSFGEQVSEEADIPGGGQLSHIWLQRRGDDFSDCCGGGGGAWDERALRG